MLRIATVNSDRQIPEAQILFREYASAPEVAVCVVNFEQEVRTLPGDYAPPAGSLLLAMYKGEGICEAAAGCVGLRAWDALSKTCELKRLYVRHEFRNHGVGAELLKAAIQEARSKGYRRIVLDTLPTMAAAHSLYRAFGFHEISAYQKNPVPGALFFELTLS